MIKLSGITKTYRVRKRETGMKNAVKSFFSHKYEILKALDDVSFTVNDGEMVGYIGPNGAGKSSTVKIMSGILTPDSGLCEIDGLTPWKSRKEHVKNIGVVFGQRSQLWWDVPVCDSFALLKDIYSVSDADYDRVTDELIERLSLQEIIKTPARQLSLGQRMRCEIAASLIHEPKILFLDEPTIGLDAVSKIAVREFLKDINREKKTTMILTTHDMQDIEALTERILLIGKGKILLDGSLDELKMRDSAVKKLVVRYSSGSFETTDGITLIRENSGEVVFGVDTLRISVSKAIEQITRKAEITDLEVMGSTAEELVVSLYRDFGI